MTGIEFVIVALASFRVTRLVVFDQLTEPLRERTVYKLSDTGLGGWTKDLFDCPWCIGFWFAALFTLGWAWSSDVTFWIALPFAFSAVTGLVSRNLDPH